MNFGVKGRLPVFRENTVESFLHAVAAGATFVEFDVQVLWRFDTRTLDPCCTQFMSHCLAPLLSYFVGGQRLFLCQVCLPHKPAQKPWRCGAARS